MIVAPSGDQASCHCSVRGRATTGNVQQWGTLLLRGFVAPSELIQGKVCQWALWATFINEICRFWVGWNVNVFIFPLYAVSYFHLGLRHLGIPGVFFSNIQPPCSVAEGEAMGKGQDLYQQTLNLPIWKRRTLLVKNPLFFHDRGKGRELQLMRTITSHETVRKSHFRWQSGWLRPHQKRGVLISGKFRQVGLLPCESQCNGRKSVGERNWWLVLFEVWQALGEQISYHRPWC